MFCGFCSSLPADQRLFPPSTSPATSALTREDMDGTVGVVAPVTVIHFAIPLCWLTSAREAPGRVWCLPEAPLMFQPNLWVMLAVNFCSICHKHCHRLVYQTSHVVNGWSCYRIATEIKKAVIANAQEKNTIHS